MKISAVIIARDEEDSIARALASVDFADEIVVVDSGSTDQTRDIASRLGARVLEREWTGFADQKRFAVQAAANDWILSIDADEAVSLELRQELIGLRQNGPAADGYRFPRLAFYMGRPIRHSGWYPDAQIRLFDRTKGNWKPLPVHESVEMIKGSTVGRLTGDLHHFTVDDAAQHHRMIGERYAPLSARLMYDRGERASVLDIVIAGPLAFIRSYILKTGFLDGFPGFVIAKFAAHHAFLKQLLLWELTQGPNPDETRDNGNHSPL